MQIAESYGLETEEDLQKHLINSIQVRMGTTTCSEDVANALKLVLPIPLLICWCTSLTTSYSNSNPPTGPREHHMRYQSKRTSSPGGRTRS